MDVWGGVCRRWGKVGRWGRHVCGRGRHRACRRQRRGVHLRARSPVGTSGEAGALRRAALWGSVEGCSFLTVLTPVYRLRDVAGGQAATLDHVEMLQVDKLPPVTTATLTHKQTRSAVRTSWPHDRLSLVRSRAAAAIAERPFLGGERKASEHAVEGALQGREGAVLQRLQGHRAKPEPLSLYCVLPGAAAALTADPAKRKARGSPRPVVGRAPREGEDSVSSWRKSCSTLPAPHGATYPLCSARAR